jgi:hypothetical protein
VNFQSGPVQVKRQINHIRNIRGYGLPTPLCAAFAHVHAPFWSEEKFCIAEMILCSHMFNWNFNSNKFWCIGGKPTSSRYRCLELLPWGTYAPPPCCGGLGVLGNQYPWTGYSFLGLDSLSNAERKGPQTTVVKQSYV